MRRLVGISVFMYLFDFTIPINEITVRHRTFFYNITTLQLPLRKCNVCIYALWFKESSKFGLTYLRVLLI